MDQFANGCLRFSERRPKRFLIIQQMEKGRNRKLVVIRERKSLCNRKKRKKKSEMKSAETQESRKSR